MEENKMSKQIVPLDVDYSSKKERQDILDKKKEIRLKRKNRKKAILLNIA